LPQYFWHAGGAYDELYIRTFFRRFTVSVESHQVSLSNLTRGHPAAAKKLGKFACGRGSDQTPLMGVARGALGERPTLQGEKKFLA